MLLCFLGVNFSGWGVDVAGNFQFNFGSAGFLWSKLVVSCSVLCFSGCAGLGSAGVEGATFLRSVFWGYGDFCVVFGIGCSIFLGSKLFIGVCFIFCFNCL